MISFRDAFDGPVSALRAVIADPDALPAQRLDALGAWTLRRWLTPGEHPDVEALRALLSDRPAGDSLLLAIRAAVSLAYSLGKDRAAFGDD